MILRILAMANPETGAVSLDYFSTLCKFLAGFQCTNLKSTGIYYRTLRTRPE